MNIKLIHTTLLTLCALLTACSDNDMSLTTNPDGKTPIELSVGGLDTQSATRAVITDGTGKDMKPFTSQTRLFLYVKSENNATSPTETKYALTFLSAASNDDDKTIVTVPDGCQLYWDDAHARDSKLTVYACAKANSQPSSMTIGQNVVNDGNNKKYNFSTTSIDPTLAWEVGAGTAHDYFDQDDLTNGDLVFSNNIADYHAVQNKTDNRLKFNTDEIDPSTYKKFDKGDLKFYHALTKVTFHVVMGDGFAENEFTFSENTNIALKGFYGKGTFNLKEGQFKTLTDADKKDFNYIAPQNPTLQTISGGTDKYYELSSYLVPGTDLKNSTVDDALTMIINGNTYKVPMKTLYDRIRAKSENQKTDNSGEVKDEVLDDGTKLKAGVNYLFTIKIGKTKIQNISAELAEWIPVKAEEANPQNSYVTVEVKTDEGSAVKGTPTFDLYRAAGASYTGDATTTGYKNYADYTWENGYEKSESLAETTNESGVYTTEWYWPDNKTFYHFRTISPTSESIDGNDAATYISMAGGIIKENEVTAKDYVWGAPFKTDSPSPDNYSFSSGYCDNETKANGQLYKAIGATTNKITLIQHHMTSQVFVDLENDGTVAETNRVNVTNATVQLIDIAPSAKLYLGNGLVTEYGTRTNQGMTADVQTAVTTGTDQHPAYDYSYGVIPQQLNINNSKVGLKITTADGNVYIIEDISKIKESGKNEITEWLPGKKYYYKFTLKKSGITNITATVVNWETVTADNENVTIQ